MAEYGGLLAGADAALGKYFAFKQQQIQNDQRERQLQVMEAGNNREQANFARDRLYSTNDTLKATLESIGLGDPATGKLLPEKFDEYLANKDPRLLAILPEIANQFRQGERFGRGDYSEDTFRFTEVDPVALQNGIVRVTGKHADGRLGTFTHFGTEEANDKVVQLNPMTFGQTVVQGYNLRVKPLSNLGGSSALGRANTSKALGDAIANQNTPASTTSTSPGPLSPDERNDAIAQRIVTTIDASGEDNAVGASRQFIAELALLKEGSPERQEYLEQRAFELDIDIEDLFTQQPQGFSSEELGAPNNYSDEVFWGRIVGRTAASRITDFDNRIAILDRNAKIRRENGGLNETNDRWETIYQKERDAILKAKAEYIKNQNEAVWNGLVSAKEKAQQGLARPGVTEGGIAYWSERLENADRKMKEFTRNGGRTPETETLDFKGLEERILTKLKAAEPEQVVNATRSGELNLTPNETRALQNYAIAAGVNPAAGNVIQQMTDRLPKEPVIAILSQMIGQSEPGSAKEMALIQALGRVGETGSMFESAADRRNTATTAANRGRNNSIDFNDYDRMDKETTERLSVTRGFLTPTQTSDGTTRPRSANISDVRYWTGQLGPVRDSIRKLAAAGFSQRAEEAYQDLLGQASVAIGILADQKSSGGLSGWFQDKWYEYFGTRPSQDFYAQNLKNIRVNPDAVNSGRVREIYVVDDDGRRTGKVITASELSGVAGDTLFDLLTYFGRENTRADIQNANQARR